MITRDMVQGFIDGLKTAGDDLSDLETKVENWLLTHHTYPQDEATAKKICDDLTSYKR
jgi:hypothetical protein